MCLQCSAKENGRRFHTLRENETVELLPQNLATSGQQYYSTDDNCYLKNICWKKQEKKKTPVEAVQGQCQGEPSVVRHLVERAWSCSWWQNWQALTDANSLHQFRGRPPSNTHGSLWTTPQSILYLNHKNGVPVPHLFQTLRFHTGFAEPPKNPCIITQYPVFGHKGHPPTFNLSKFGNN